MLYKTVCLWDMEGSESGVRQAQSLEAISNTYLNSLLCLVEDL